MSAAPPKPQEPSTSAADTVERLTGSIVAPPAAAPGGDDPFRSAGGFLSEFQPGFAVPERPHKRAGWGGANGSLGLYQLAGFYAPLRAIGYFWEAKANDIIAKLESNITSPSGKAGPFFVFLGRNRGLNPDSKSQLGSLWNMAKPDAGDLNNNFSGALTRAKALINLAEFATFGTFTLVSLHYERKLLHELTDMAVRAETGHPHGTLKVSDLQKSENPIVMGAVARFTRRRNMHIPAGFGFLHSAQTGILLNAAVITGERMAFNPTIALDILKKSLDEVQAYEMGDALAKGQLINNLMHVMQQAQIDCKRETIPSDQMQALVPVLSVIAQDAIEKKIGLEEAVYVMGGGVLIPGNPQQSMQNYRHFEKTGIDGITLENKRSREHAPHLKREGWVGQIGEAATRGRPDSTQPDALRRRHAEIAARAYVHSNANPARRSGAAPAL